MHTLLSSSARTLALLLPCLAAFAQVPFEQRLQPTAARQLAWLDTAGRPLPFADYVRNAHALISGFHHAAPAGGWPGLHEPLADAIGPRQWPIAGSDCTTANTEGVLLVHGLTDSPFLMRDLGDALARTPLVPGRCTLVRSLLLPGHGTAPGDLLGVRHEDWAAATRYGLESFAGEAARVHLVGFSTGGALGLHWAYRQQAEALQLPLSSLVLMSPAIQPKDRMARRTWLLKFIAWTGAMKWLDEHDDRDFAKYESFPLNAGTQIALLDKSLERPLQAPVPVPVFMALSRNDDTIASEASIDVFLRQTDPRSRMWLVLPREPDRNDETVQRARADARVTIADVGTLAPQFLDFAHTSFPVAPANTHYGTNGYYANCLHYTPELIERFRACITPQMRESMGLPAGSAGSTAPRYGETVRGEAPPEGPLLRRLTFNPLFEEMLGQVRAFLVSVTGR